MNENWCKFLRTQHLRCHFSEISTNMYLLKLNSWSWNKINTYSNFCENGQEKGDNGQVNSYSLTPESLPQILGHRKHLQKELVPEWASTRNVYVIRDTISVAESLGQLGDTQSNIYISSCSLRRCKILPLLQCRQAQTPIPEAIKWRWPEKRKKYLNNEKILYERWIPRTPHCRGTSFGPKTKCYLKKKKLPTGKLPAPLLKPRNSHSIRKPQCRSHWLHHCLLIQWNDRCLCYWRIVMLQPEEEKEEKC